MSNFFELVKKILFLINDFKISFLFLLFFSFFASILEVLSIGSLIPLISVLTGNQSSFGIYYIDKYLGILNFNHNLEPIYLVSLIIIFLFFIKFLFFLLLNYFKNFLIYKINQDLSEKLFNKYISQSYEFFLKNDSSSLVYRINEVENSTVRIILNIIDSVVDFFIFIFISIFLSFYNLKITAVTIAVLFISSYSYYYFIKPRLSKYGSLRTEINTKRIKNIQESFFGIKEIKIFNMKNIALSKFKINNELIFKNQAKEFFINSNTKNYLELVIIFFFIISVIFSYSLKLSLSEIFLTSSIFLISILRILPITIRLFLTIQLWKTRKESFFTVYNDFSNLHDNNRLLKNKNFNSFKKKIIFENVSYSYPGNKKKIFNNISFEINNGDIIYLNGPSGIGKTTLIGLVTGLLKPSSGVIFFDDFNFNDSNLNFFDLFSYVPQSVYLSDGTIKYNITLKENNNIDYSLFEKTLNMSLIREIIKDFPLGVDTNIGENGLILSGGQRQRLGIARAIYKKSDILILDESTNSLDIAAEEKILTNIFNEKFFKVSIVVNHRDNLKKFCNKIINIKDSQVSIKNL